VNLTVTENLITREKRYTLTIDQGELQAVRFYPFDRALLEDVRTSGDVSIADQLLALEMVARRIEESV
jgi:hypothetical protein